MVEPGSPSRIALVSDDDALIRRVVAVALERDGWTVREAADAPTTIAVIESEAIQLCVLDRLIPGPSLEDRLEILARHRPGAAVIVLSGAEVEELPEGAVSLRKPVELAALRDGIDRALAAAEARGSATAR